MTTNKKFMTICNMRLSSDNKNYMEAQLVNFASRIVDGSNGEILEVQFGKQDTRGGFSITLIDSRHCVPHQEHFQSKEAMLGYVIGYNASFEKNYNRFNLFAGKKAIAEQNRIKEDDFERVKNDINGNPRYVLHFLALANDYTEALQIAKKDGNGGRKYDNKSFGGGIVFSTYNLNNLAESLESLKTA